jgi:hypothetical protein
VEGEGFRILPFNRVDAARVERTIMEIGGLTHARDLARVRRLSNSWLLGTAEAQVQDIDDALGQFPADALVCDPTLLGLLLVVPEAYRLPTAVMSHLAACLLPGPDGPIPGLPLPRPRTALGRLGRQAIRRGLEFLHRDVRAAADALRARYGLPRLGTTLGEYTGTMPLYLVQSTPEYDYQRIDLPPSVHYVGPCLWDGPGGGAPPPWLSEVPDDRPLIYVTEGTTHVREPIVLRSAIQGLADLPVTVVATTGRHRQPDQLGLGQTPSNVHIEQFIPQSLLLTRARIVITTGGSNTTLAALREGTPLVLVPCAWDQPENAWRVSDAGAGVRLSPAQCSPARMRDAVQRILGDRAFSDAAARLADSFQRYGGPAQAAELVEQLASRAALNPPENASTAHLTLTKQEHQISHAR